TLGAATGAAVVTYGLLPTLGVTVALGAAAAVNLLIGGAALVLTSASRRTTCHDVLSATMELAVAHDAPQSSRVDRDRAPILLLLIGFALSGLAAMGYEVVWARLLGLVMGSSVYAFGTLVVVLLTGLGLGSVLYGRLRFEPSGHFVAFGVIEIFLAVAAATSLLTAPHLPFVLMRLFPVARDAFGWLIVSQFVLAALVAFLPSLLMGAAFPAAVGGLRPGLTRVGRAIGTAYGANTVGTVVGAFLAGFVLIPGIGLRATIIVGVIANLVAGVSVLFVAIPWRRRWPLLAPALAVLAVVVTLPPWPREVFAVGTGFFAPMFATS